MAKLTSKLLIILCLSFFIFSCSKDKTSNSGKGPLKKEFIPVSDSLNSLQNEILENIILGSSDNRSKKYTKLYLVELENILIYLSVHPTDKSQIYRGLKITQKLTDLMLPLADRARINPVARDYNTPLAYHAMLYGVDISQFNWSIFSYDFNDGLKLFWTKATKATWLTSDGNSVNSQTKANARASKYDPNKAWLISPKFDFTNITNPEIQLRHTIQISRGDGPLNTADVLKQGYKLLVSSKYNFGKPLVFPEVLCNSIQNNFLTKQESECVDEIIWEEIEFDKPKGDDFHAITTNPASLKKYTGKKNVFIALLLNLDSDATKLIGAHFNNWSIYEFNLLGSGVLPTPISLPLPILNYEFPNADLSPLLTFKTDPIANDWTFGTFKDFSYAATTTQNAPNTSYQANLIYPDIDLTTTSSKLFLNIEHSVRPALDTYDFWQRLKLKISEDYIPGTAPSTASWTELDIKSQDEIVYDRFNKLSKYGIDISKYANKNISLNFEFGAEVDDNHLWQINKISITTIKTGLK